MSLQTVAANTNEACCTIPPVEVEVGEYTPKGEYKAFGGYDKTYVTGPKGTGKAIVVVFDVFGFSSQALQGGDILAKLSDAQVVMPDFFKGNGLTGDIFHNKTEENQKKLQTWWATTGHFASHIAPIQGVADALRADGYKKIGFVGYCWGGKVVTIAGNDASKVDGVVAIHPARVDPNDAEGLAVPIGLFPSKDEPKEDCDAFMKGLDSKPFAKQNAYKIYETMHHGWAGARGNLKDEANLEQYKDVLTRTAGFFTTVLVV